MEEKLYTIPVKEAFEADCECPICKMRDDIEKDVIAFAMGPSYMEDYIRFETDKKGFCKNHAKKMYEFNNRLGLALIMETHLQKTNKDIGALAESKSGGFFKKKDKDPLLEYLDKLNNSCFVCDRVNNTFERYIATIFHLWKNGDKEFLSLFEKSKGFCTEHLTALLKAAKKELSGSRLEEFNKVAVNIYLKNMQRIFEDVEWFEKKFDYRFKDEPWKNSKDALIRTLCKTNGITDIKE